MKKLRLKDDLLPVALLLAFAPVAGASSFSVSIGLNIPGGGAKTIINAPGQVSVQQGASKGDGITFAAGGRVGVDAIIGVDPPNGPSNTTGSLAGNALAFFDDLILTGPNATITRPFSIPFAGIFGYTVDLLGTPSDQSFVTGEIDLNGSIACFCNVQNSFLPGGVSIGFDSRSGASILQSNNSTQNLQLLSSISIPITVQGQPLAGFSVSNIYGVSGVISGTITEPTGVPLTLQLTLTTNGQVIANGFGGGSVFIDFGHTLGFEDGVPVFDLPAGFSANSVSMGLVDNVIGTPNASTPEPASFGLSMAALLGIGLLRRVVVTERRAGG